MVLASSIYIRVYVDSHSLGQLALASKRTASCKKIMEVDQFFWVAHPRQYLGLDING